MGVPAALAPLAALAFLAALAAPGVVFLRRFAPALAPLERLAYGIPLGTVAGSLGLLALACAFGLRIGVIVPWAVACAATAIAVARGGPAPRLAPPSKEPSRGGRVLVALVVIAFVARWAVLWSTVLTVDRGGLEGGFINLWADWSEHLGDVSTFAWGDNFPPTHPRLWGHPFAYHYLTSVTAAAMVRLGLDPIVALPLQSFLFSVLLLLATIAFARRVTGGAGAAALAALLLLLGGGWGWWVPVRDALATHDPLRELLRHPWDRVRQDAANVRWPQFYYALVAPQRAYLYGLPIGLLVFRLLDAGRREGRRAFVLAGCVAGLLPLAHQGTLLALAVTTPFLVLLFPTREWLWFFLVWIAVAVPQMAWLFHGAPGALRALRLQPGWLAAPDAWPWFWIKNLGLMLPIAAAGLAWRGLLTPAARRFLVALMPAFVIANLVVFQPWDWDNTKLLTFWYFGVCMLVAAVIARAWSRWPIARPGLVVLLATLLLSGVLYDFNVFLGRERAVMLTHEELDLARQIRERTPPRALFAAGLRHNHPVSMLTGRHVLVGYTGWLWSQGMRYDREVRDLRAILAFTPEARALIARDHVDYVVIGPEERDQLGARPAAFDAAYPCVVRTASYRVYAVSAAAIAASPRAS